MRALLWFGGGFLLLCGGLVVLPGIDLWTSALFYRPGDGFFLGDWPPFRIAHEYLSIVVWAYALAVVAALIAGLALRRSVLGLTPRAAIFLLLSLALGPGLTVNTVFKDHWGRARPVQIAAFGGTQKFTPAFVPSDQCNRNCSFPAGDPAMGFYLVSAALLAGSAAARRNGIIAAVVGGGALGVVRLAQGGHFLSDIIAAGFFVGGIAWGLHWLIMTGDHVERLAAALRHPSPGLRRCALLTIVTAAAFAIAYEWIDIPVARAFKGIGPTTHAVFGVITRFGEGGVYLVPLGLAFLWAWRKGARDWAWRTGIVFAAIALPGILADIMKPVFGRARPVLLFRENLYGFTWRSAHANAWSFPSGHSITVVALAVSLYAIYPPLWPAYALLALLVMASRIVLDMHYLSDVIVGAYFGSVAAWALVAAAKQRGVALTLETRLSDNP
ncbi:MAG TPA: phosphatase PAP2 family protein [Stellaceae bacterium]